MSQKHGPNPQGEIVTSHWRVGNAKDGKNNGLWSCIVCNDGVWRERKNILSHVGAEKHRKAVKYHISSRSRVNGQHNVSGRKKQPSSNCSSKLTPSSSASTNSGQASLGDRRVLGSLTNLDRAQNTAIPSIKRLCDLYLSNREREWFPWPDKITCLLDVMRHLPGATLFDNQNSTLTWGLKMVSTSDIPSDAHMKLVSALLQQMYGVDTFNNQGTYGNNYYVNNLKQIIAQEVANPRVRPHLEFYPEDTSGSFANANKTHRWLRDMDAEFTTPMVRQNQQDFYLFEPCLLVNGTLCVPIRWFKRSETFYGLACRLQSVHSDTETAWVVSVDDQFEIRQDTLYASFAVLSESYEQRGIADPRAIKGIRECDSNKIKPWHHTDPRVGNRWRAKACGHRVLAFPIWLYCESSGALTNGLTYHSFLFAPAGLPQEQTNNQYNIHFLCTSATAHPLEMFEGIFSQIQEGQENGVWAWDSFYNEVVLLVPSIFALLGDSSLQSRFASLIHPKDRLFCRMCLPSESIRCDEEKNGSYLENKKDEVMVSPYGSVVDDVEECCRQAKQFFTIGELRTKQDTVETSKKAFAIAMTTGKKAPLEEIESRFGIRDEYQHTFISTVPSLVSTVQQLNAENARSYLAGLQGKVINPVWKSRGLDPHRHSPIEPVQVILSGLVNVFWRDTVALLSSSDKKTLLVRLLSFDTSGLDYDHISGGRCLQHPSALTTADYKAIVQAVPFVLYDLVDLRLYDAWISLCFLVRLTWQPIISNLEEYLEYLEITINNFISFTMRWSPTWATKAEFHMILHLPQHIHDFGPATLLSAEKLDFYSDFIQRFNINYRGEAPSKDIARAFAYAHRIRHLLSGGKVFSKEEQDLQTTDQVSSAPEQERPPHMGSLISCGRAVNELLEQDDRLRKAYGFTQKSHGVKGEKLMNSATKSPNPTLIWDQTTSSQVISSATSLKMRLLPKMIAKCSSINLINGDKCSLNEWVILASGSTTFQVGKVVEILQTTASDADASGNLSAVLILKYERLDEQFQPYGMSRLINTGIYDLVDPKKLLRVVNVQHNCRGNNCRTNPDENSFDVEQGNSRINGIVHMNPDDVLFNCVQSCDFRMMRYFSCDTRRADFELAIREGYEYSLSKEQDICDESIDVVPRQEIMQIPASVTAKEVEVYCDSRDEILDGSVSITSN